MAEADVEPKIDESSGLTQRSQSEERSRLNERSQSEDEERVALSGGENRKDYHTNDPGVTVSPAKSYHSTVPGYGFVEPYSHIEPTFTPKPPYHTVLSQLTVENTKPPTTRVISRSESQIGGERCGTVKRLILPLPCQGTNDRCYWSRKNGFCLSVSLLLVGTGIFVFSSMSDIEAYKKTSRFQQGLCTTHETAVITETEMFFMCPEANCEKSCKEVNFTCNQVFGRLYSHVENRSQLMQIYATFDDSKFFRGRCSYKPKKQCQLETESHFEDFTELGSEYKCYFSSLRQPKVKVVLHKEKLDMDTITIPLSLIGCGSLICMAVKFVGHRCGCPSEDQIKKKEEQEMEQLEMQPTVV